MPAVLLLSACSARERCCWKGRYRRLICSRDEKICSVVALYGVPYAEASTGKHEEDADYAKHLGSEIGEEWNKYGKLV